MRCKIEIVHKILKWGCAADEANSVPRIGSSTCSHIPHHELESVLGDDKYSLMAGSFA